jgi:hypothetical protein
MNTDMINIRIHLKLQLNWKLINSLYTLYTHFINDLPYKTVTNIIMAAGNEI